MSIGVVISTTKVMNFEQITTFVEHTSEVG